MNEIMHTVTKPFSEMLRFVRFHVTSISMQNFVFEVLFLTWKCLPEKEKSNALVIVTTLI